MGESKRDLLVNATVAGVGPLAYNMNPVKTIQVVGSHASAGGCVVELQGSNINSDAAFKTFGTYTWNGGTYYSESETYENAYLFVRSKLTSVVAGSTINCILGN